MGVVIETLQRLKAKVADSQSRATFVETRIQEMVTKTASLHKLIEKSPQTVPEQRARVASFVDAKM